MGSLLRRYLLGDRAAIAGTVYGTIVVLSVVAAGAKTYEHQLWRLGSIAAISAVVLWVAHVYSDALGESLAVGRRITFSEILGIARREYAIVLAAVLPVWPSRHSSRAHPEPASSRSDDATAWRRAILPSVTESRPA
jgi:hypothetical protein